MSDLVTRRLSITGLVQGVGFRWATVAEAQRLGVAGWVRNRLDGSVEAVVRGPPAAVRSLIEWAHRGPPGAVVSRVMVDEWNDPVEPGFHQIPTI